MSTFPSSQTVQLRILATSDLHMNLTAYDYYTDRHEPTIGLTRTADLIRKARSEVQDGLVLLVDNGDSVQGTPLGDWAVAQHTERHVLMQAFDLLGYDAIGLGNHDYGFGLDVLDRIMRHAPCPVLCSNAHKSTSPQVWQEHTIVRRQVDIQGHAHELAIGIFSVLPPQTAKWEAHKLAGAVQIDDILDCARRKVAELHELGCDIVVALAHTGFGPAQDTSGMENALMPLTAIDGIDAVAAGHSHMVFPGPKNETSDYIDADRGLVHSTPVVMPGAAGSHLGVIDLTVGTSPGSRWQVLHAHAQVRSVSTEATGEDAALTQLLATGHTETRRRVAEPVGQVKQHMHSYFSFCGYDRGLAFVAAAQTLALRPFLKDTDYRDCPILSAVSPSKFGGRAGPRFFTDVPAGEICLRHVTDLNVFPDEMMAVAVTGSQIEDWLEMSAGVFNRMIPGQRCDLLASDRAGHNFDVLHGLTYRIDLSQPARFGADGALLHPSARRVREIRFEGQPLDAEQTFVVALNNYRANGGGHFPFAGRATRVPLPILPLQDLVKNYVTAGPHSGTVFERPFRLSPVAGAVAVLRTGHKARNHLDDISEFAPNIAGEDEAGFLMIHLTL